MSILESIRTIPDFPKAGIVYYDITTMLADPKAFKQVNDGIEAFVKKTQADKIVVIESRGFIFGSVIADRLSMPLILVRKAGKLPGETIAQKYSLEYGANQLEIHTDSIVKSDKVVIIDDLLATGGTTEAAAKLIERLGGEVVGISTVIALKSLPYREKLANYNLHVIKEYE